ncbi:MAG: hypothetical protein EXR73_13880 [Myxococcales bacterium]|nr:hypothetical protein [Myxococcales bacterium]
MRTIGAVVAVFVLTACTSAPLPAPFGDGGSIGDAATGTDAATTAPADLAAPIVTCAANPPTFPSFDRTCAADGDCFIARHQTDCCGTIVAWGLRSTEQAAFAAAEKVCESQYPGCGCASNKVTTDDGTMTTMDHPIAVHCAAGMCRTTVM